MPRYFTVAEAERALPEVESALREILFHREEHRKAHEVMETHARRIRMAGGSRVNPGPLLAVRARRDTSAAALKGAVDRVEEAGALLKDVEIGLIDFLAHYRGQTVCLCWKLGEDRIRFWHGLEEGFRGRKPIDDEFLENHRGETTN
ncbi:MAG TPA: DUF2203 domain-containing protein [Bryobacteraceae bacterium]|nr:DUF2203 domain-containing protein [Bryobacteraceae bacterium]